MPTTFANTIDGNEILAKRSQCDYAGNDLQTTYATNSEVTTGLASKQDTISDLATIRSGAALGATAVQPGDLATVATTGAYSDLTGTPTIPSGSQLVPAATSADADKVLTVDAQGTPAWETPSGGGGSSEVIGAFNYTDKATYESINKVIISSNTSDAYKTLVGTGSYSDDLFGYNTFSAQTGFVFGSALVWINPYGQDWSDLLSVNSIFGLGEFRTMTGTDSTQLTFDHPVPGFFKGQGRLVQFASNQERNSVIWEAQFDMPEFDNGSYTWYYNKGYTCKVTKVNGTFTPEYSLLFVIVNGEDAPDFYGQNLSYIADYILTGDYLYGYSGNNIIHASKSVTLDKVNGVPNTSGYSQGDVLTIDSNGGAVWSTPAAGGVTDVEVDGTSVVSGGVASITMPTVDQTYDASSSNAQSGVAVAGALSTKQDTISDLATIRSGAADGATAVQPGDLATVAVSGSYNDLSNTPTIPAAQVNSDWNASSGVAEILNKPTILPYKPVVAGTGVRIVDDTANNRIVVEADETVLWEAPTDAGTTLELNQYVTLSESMTHFEKVRIYYALQKAWAGKGVFESYMVDGDLKVNLHDVWYREQSGFNVWYETFTYNKYTDSDLKFTQAGGVQRAILNSTWDTTSGLTTIVYKIVGIHRIASN